MNINIGPIKLQNKIGPVNYKNIDPFIDSRKNYEIIDLVLIYKYIYGSRVNMSIKKTSYSCITINIGLV
jgi:hypothetical protein